jgi:hypothetical protein
MRPFFLLTLVFHGMKWDNSQRRTTSGEGSKAMRFFRLCFLGTLIFALASGPLAAQQSVLPIDAGQIYKRVSPAVVLIEGLNSKRQPDKQGSGFLVSSDGRILTNFHVIAHSKEATVRLANGDAYDDVQVLSVDKRKDIALIKIKAVDLAFMALGRSGSIEIGSAVYAVGNPLGLQNTLSQGLVSGVRQFDGYQYFQISAPISPGSSGGPVVAADGTVIGIAVGSLEGGQNLNFAIPIDYAKGMLTSNQPQPLTAFYEPEPEGEAKPVAQAAQESVTVPADAKKNLAAFLVSKLGQWKSPDVVSALGKPIREYATEGAQAMKQYEYGDSTNLWRGIRLTFEHGSDTLIAVATYPWNMTVAQIKILWGENFNTYRIEKDTLIMYAYVDRPLLVVANDLGAVDSITTYVPGIQRLADFELPTTASPGVSVPRRDTPREETNTVLDVNGLKTKLGVLTSDEAITTFGQPYRRYIMPGKKRSDDLDVCVFVDRTETVRRITLSFNANSKRLDSIVLYPYSTKASDLVAQLGRSYKTQRASGGLTLYVYSNKPVLLYLGPSGEIFSVNIVRTSPAWRAFNGEDWSIRLDKPTHKAQPGSEPSNIGTPASDFARSRNERILLVERSLGMWTIEDARREFGPPATQEAIGDRAQNTDGDKYGFRDPSGGFVLVSLFFYRASGKLVTANLAPAGMNRQQLVSLFGDNFVEEQGQNGDRLYKYRDRPLTATVDSLGNVAMLLASLEI